MNGFGSRAEDALELFDFEALLAEAVAEAVFVVPPSSLAEADDCWFGSSHRGAGAEVPDAWASLVAVGCGGRSPDLAEAADRDGAELPEVLTGCVDRTCNADPSSPEEEDVDVFRK